MCGNFAKLVTVSTYIGCIPVGLGHNDPWVESHMWPQQTWGQRLSRDQWPLVQVFEKRVTVSTYLMYFCATWTQWLWVESHMWPQQTWSQKSCRGQWPLVQVFERKGHCIHHRLIKTQIGHARDFAWYRGQRPSPARVILSHERIQIHVRENLCSYVTKSATLSCAWVVIVRHFNHARRGRALAAISGKAPSVSGVWYPHTLMYFQI